MATGKLESAKEVFKKIAALNNACGKTSDFDDEFLRGWEAATCELPNAKKFTMMGHLKNTLNQMKIIIASPVARTRFLLYLYPWFVSGLAYYGIFLSVRFVHVDKYVLVLISCLTEIPVLLFASWAANKVFYFFKTPQSRARIAKYERRVELHGYIGHRNLIDNTIHRLLLTTYIARNILQSSLLIPGTSNSRIS